MRQVKNPQDINTTQRTTGNSQKLGAEEVILPKEQHTNWLSSVTWLASRTYIHTSNIIQLSGLGLGIYIYVYTYIYTCMYPITISVKRAMNLKKPWEDCMLGLEERRERRNIAVIIS